MVTRDFQSDTPLSEKTLALLSEIFGRNWASPEKLHHNSRQVAIHLATAKESVAQMLSIDPTELEIVGGTSTALSLGISGLLTDTSTHFYFGGTDRRTSGAAATLFEKRGGRTTRLESGSDGQINYSTITKSAVVTAWQSVNRETGVIQQSAPASGSICADMTCEPYAELPTQWDTAIWEPASWGGPRGIGFLAINKSSTAWRNPGAQIADYRSAPDFSVPLFIASAVALEEALATRDDLKIADNYEHFVSVVKSLRPDVIIAGETSPRTLRKISLILPGIEAEEALRSLEKSGFLVDSGSACITPELHPSNVLKAMGLSQAGNLRVTLRENQSRQDCEELAKAIAALS